MSAQFGLDPLATGRGLAGLPRYFRDLASFRSRYSGPLELRPCLHDRRGEGGAIRDEYFWQDLLVARMIHAARPAKHVDVGSRVDGFVAHVASFREVEVFDIRPTVVSVPGVVFRQADFMKPVKGLRDYCDSLSCLHALEHFGLGRYGDPIDPEGVERGLANLACLLREDGVFYLSVPIGSSRVEFNAHRICDPEDLVASAARLSLCLTGLVLVHPDGPEEVPEPNAERLREIARRHYVLGLFTFVAKRNKDVG
jgi:SAM-dependent methyltransferase